MSAKQLSTLTHEVIHSYGNTAKNVVNAYRSGNARAVAFVDQRWTSAVDQFGTRLGTEVRANAVQAQKLIADYYTRGVNLGSDSAEAVIGKAVNLADKGVAQVAANATRFEEATRVQVLSNLATAVLPAARAVSDVAQRLEERSSQLAHRVAGAKATVKRAAPKRRTVRKAAPVAKRAATRSRKAA